MRIFATRFPMGQASTRFASLLNGPADALAAYIPDFNYVLYDLTQFSDEQIKGTVMARVAMLLFKHIFDPQVRDKLPAVLSLLVDLSQQQTVPQYFETVFRYIINNIDDVSAEDLTSTNWGQALIQVSLLLLMRVHLPTPL
jgi:hypothetical protein